MSTAHKRPSAGARILAVDDVEAKRYAWERILTRAGFDVFTASTGHEALRRAKENPDLIILDVRLPDLGGMEVCRRIKDEPATASIPVLHISASLVTSEDRTTALEGGADGYLTEPVDPEELVASVRALLRMRAAEERARKAASEWQSTFDAIQDGLVVADARGKVARCNRAFGELVGKPLDEILGYGLRELMEEMKFPGEDLFRQLPEEGARRSAELQWGSRWVRVTLDPILNGTDYAGSTGTFSDVTPRKTAEHEVESAREQLRQLNVSLEERVAERTKRLRMALQELEAFAYTVAHDLRAPLRAMHRFSEALVEEYGTRLDENGQTYARRITAGAVKMDLLIHDLLEYSRLTQSELHAERLDPGPLVEETVGRLSSDPALGAPELIIERPLPEVVADRFLLSQVLLNLLSNAIKFVPPGTTPRVRVSAERGEGVVTLSVHDNGIGIPEDAQARLFRVFERLGSAKDYPGTGIGLAIVRRATERLGGECGVESSPGRGSRFWIRLPSAENQGRPR